MAKVVAVNVGKPRPIDRGKGRVETSAIWKEPVSGRLAVRGVNIEGDDQADRSIHGGPNRAVYAYAAEDTDWWGAELGRELGPGIFGENLTLSAGDEVEIVERPDHDVTLGLFVEAYEHDRTLLPRLLEADALPATWRDWIEEMLGRYSSTK